MAALRPDSTVCISGRTGEGLTGLLSLVQTKLASGMVPVEVGGVSV